MENTGLTILKAASPLDLMDQYKVWVSTNPDKITASVQTHIIPIDFNDDDCGINFYLSFVWLTKPSNLSI